MSEIIAIPLEQLKEHKQNQKYFTDITGSDYQLLCQSIEVQGILTPLLVQATKDGTYTVLSGHQRLRAGRDLGLETAPCLLLAEDLSEARGLDILTQANLGRSISIAERYKIAERLIELEQDNRKDNGHKGGNNKKLSGSAHSGHNAQNQKPKRERVAQQAGLTDHDMKALYKVKTLPFAEQEAFWVWLQESNPNKKTIAEKLKKALEQNKLYKQSDKELNKLKRKAKLAKELQDAGNQIQTPEDYRDGLAIEALRTELATIRVANSEAFGRIQAIKVPNSPMVHNWVQREAAELCELLREQAQNLGRHFGIQPQEQEKPAANPMDLMQDDSDWNM